MRFGVRVIGDIIEDMRKETEAGENAVKRTMVTVAKGLQRDWRNQVAAAGLGRGVANSVRSESYPTGKGSLNAAALVWSRSPRILDAHNRGGLIRAKKGLMLAIPLPAAGNFGGGRITPGQWQARTGIELRPVARRNRTIILVADDARISNRGMAVMNRRRVRKKDGIRSGSMTVPIFILVPQVNLKKVLDLEADANSWARRIPTMITGNWRD